jgi:hypothetical protein
MNRLRFSGLCWTDNCQCVSMRIRCSPQLAVLVVGAGFPVLPATPTLESIPIPGTKAFPESITSTTDGTLYVGRLGDGGILRVKPRSRESTIFVQPGASGSRSISGVFADEASNTLWACSNDLSSLGAPATGSDTGSALKAFDLKTGNGKRSVSLPGSHAFCNDITVDAKGSIYVTDSANPTILKLSAGATTFEAFAQDPIFSAGSNRWCRARRDRLWQRWQPLCDELHGWQTCSRGSQGGKGRAHQHTLGQPSTELSRRAPNPRQHQLPPGRGLRSFRSRGDPRRRFRRHPDSWWFCDPDVRCPDKHDSVGH